MTAKRLAIPACQRILAWEQLVVAEKRSVLPSRRYCGKPSIAVNVYPDGREQFVCVEHDDLVAETAPTWGTHRRCPSALNV